MPVVAPVEAPRKKKWWETALTTGIDLGGDILANRSANRTATRTGDILAGSADSAGARISDATNTAIGAQDTALTRQEQLLDERRKILQGGGARQEGLYGDATGALDAAGAEQKGLYGDSTAALDAAGAEQKGLYDTRRADYDPYAAAGRQGLTAMQKLVGDDERFDVSKVAGEPGYEFQRAEGEKAVQMMKSGNN